jgi:hypothetical protein
MVIVGLVAIVDLAQDGMISPSLIALFISVFGPLTPALVLRSRRNGHD